jgi:hypothetical protein
LELDYEKDRRSICKVKDTREPFAHASLKTHDLTRDLRFASQNISGVAGVYRAG